MAQFQGDEFTYPVEQTRRWANGRGWKVKQYSAQHFRQENGTGGVVPHTLQGKDKDGSVCIYCVDQPTYFLIAGDIHLPQRIGEPYFLLGRNRRSDVMQSHY